MRFRRYDDALPHSRHLVTLYLAEKGLELPTEEVNLRSGAHLSDAFAAKNPECTVPVLELDDGTCLWESIAIRQYLETLHPDPQLLGREPLERARITQWMRWLETNGFTAVAKALRNSAPRLKDRALTGPCPVAQIEALVEPKIGVGTLVCDDEQRVLLVRRAVPPEKGKWALQAGYVDPDEHPRDAAARETLEETGLIVEIRELVGVYHNPPGRRGDFHPLPWPTGRRRPVVSPANWPSPARGMRCGECLGDFPIKISPPP